MQHTNNTKYVLLRLLGRQDIYPVMLCIRTGASTIKEIGETLGISPQDVRRILILLKEFNLLKHEARNGYSLSTLGEIVLDTINSLITCWENSNFINTHELPNGFENIIQCADVINGIPEVMVSIERILSKAKETLLVITSSNVCIKMINNFLQLKNLRGDFRLISNTDDKSLDTLAKNGFLIRFSNKPLLYEVMINDVEALLFLRRSNYIDYSAALRGEEKFRNYCKTLFDDAWHKTTPYSIEQTLEVE